MNNFDLFMKCTETCVLAKTHLLCTHGPTDEETKPNVIITRQSHITMTPKEPERMMEMRTVEQANEDVPEGRARTKSRNSWANIHMQSVRLVGTTTVIDEDLLARVKYGTVALSILAILTCMCFVTNSIFFYGQLNALNVLMYILVPLDFLVMCTVLYKNVSMAIARRLLKEPNVIFMILLAAINTAIEKGAPNGFIYMFGVLCFVFLDSVKIRERKLTFMIVTAFVLVNIWNIYSRYFRDTDVGVILGSLNENIVFRKRSIQRSIFIEVLSLAMNGIYVLYKDKECEMLMLCTGNIYRESGESTVSTQRTSRRRNTAFILGEEVYVDETSVKARGKWAVRITNFLGVIAAVLYIIDRAIFGGNNVALGITMAVFVTLCLPASILTVFYQNISWELLKRLLKEINVILILLSGLLNGIIDIVWPTSFSSPWLGAGVLFIVVYSILVETSKIKNRKMQLLTQTFFCIIVIYQILNYTVLPTSLGVVLFKYGSDYVVYKRDIKRMLFIQIFLCSFYAWAVILKDKKTQLLVFATGNIYRDTGTCSKYVEDESFALRRRMESANSISDVA